MIIITVNPRNRHILIRDWDYLAYPPTIQQKRLAVKNYNLDSKSLWYLCNKYKKRYLFYRYTLGIRRNHIFWWWYLDHQKHPPLNMVIKKEEFDIENAEENIEIITYTVLETGETITARVLVDEDENIIDNE